MTFYLHAQMSYNIKFKGAGAGEYDRVKQIFNIQPSATVHGRKRKNLYNVS